MSRSNPNENDRRRSPRFSCGGRAAIYCLPYNGIAIAGTLRNLSEGGICLNLTHGLEAGMRTEVLVKVNTLSFRAAALVKGGWNSSKISLEFLELSTRGQDALEEVLEDLVRLNALTQKLRADRIDPETACALAEEPGFRLLKAVNARVLVGVDDSEPAPALVASSPDEMRREIRVRKELAGTDVFG